MKPHLLLFMLVAALVCAAPASSRAQPAFQGGFGCDCVVPGSFVSIRSIAISNSDGAFSLGEDRIHQHTTLGQFVSSWRVSEGTGAGHITGDIAILSTGELLVSDHTDRRIIRKSPSGTTLGFVGSGGTEPGEFMQLSGVAVGPDDAIYATDVQLHRITKFTPAGDYLMHWSAAGDVRPFVDDSGNVYAGSPGLQRMYKYSPSGALLLSWGSGGTGPGQFWHEPAQSSPSGGVQGPDGLLYISDSANHRIQVFNTMGEYQYEFGAEGDGPYLFGSLGKPAFDALGNLYIPDAVNQKVHKYGPGPVPAKRSSWGAVKSIYR